ncbi:hypothetical protein [Leptospira mayottensis]|uniref:Uncharacterized protein n=1 Tax=Leptospira mayottensis 200901122 TaxID=1193010 RepID=A0AA87MUU3_9LEPT|nr:hypothetical protein [Leptospira mayottensis]EKS02313.1 hypothetical protein LEP1GSC125_0785 [Leptospira mayottensis 200901122]
MKYLQHYDTEILGLEKALGFFCIMPEFVVVRNKNTEVPTS